MEGSISDDCIYWHFDYSLLITINIALSPIHKIYSGASKVLQLSVAVGWNIFHPEWDFEYS
jgi:hypothetical protein